MKKLQFASLVGMRDQLGGYAWDDGELDELVDPKHGIITGNTARLEKHGFNLSPSR